MTSHPAVAASAQNLAAHECREWRTMGLANLRGRTRPNSLGHRVTTNVRRQNFRGNQMASERINTDIDPGFWWKKLKKNSDETFFFSFFMIKNCNLLIPSLHKGRPSYMRSLHPLKKNIQHVKRRNLWTVFYFVIIALLDPDPDPQHSKNLVCNS